jgi:hypothetical protein
MISLKASSCSKPAGFFLKYAEGDLKEQLDVRGDRTRIDYIDYDWSLNGK